MYRIPIYFLFVYCLISCNSKQVSDPLNISLADTSLSDQVIKLTKKINESPTNHEYFYLRSNEWIKSYNLKNAFSDISTALKLQENNAVYLYKKAELVMAQDSADALSAKELLSKATKIEPEFEDALFLLGKIQLARQEYESALESFDRLIEIDPNNAKAYFWKGIAFKENKFADKAEEMFFKTVETDNTYYDAYMQLGELYTTKDSKVALQFYENALKLKPNSDECMYAMGRIYQNSNQFASAYNLYSQAVDINAGHKFASYGKAFIDVKFENYEKALTTIEQILKLAPDYSSAYTLRGYIYEKSNNTDLALQSYEKALEINAQDSIAALGIKTLQKN